MASHREDDPRTQNPDDVIEPDYHVRPWMRPFLPRNPILSDYVMAGITYIGSILVGLLIALYINETLGVILGLGSAGYFYWHYLQREMDRTRPKSKPKIGKEPMPSSGLTDKQRNDLGTGADFGQGLISDFSAGGKNGDHENGAGRGDVIRLSLGPAFDTFAEVRAAMSQVGDDAVVTLGAESTITLVGVSIGTAVSGTFIFA